MELSNFAQQLTAEAESTLFDPADIELHDVTKIIFAEVERIKPTRAVFDSVSELRLLSQSALRYRRQILSIKQFLAARACTTLLLDDLTSADSRDDRQLESVCHGVIALRRDESAYGAERRQMSIRKIRGSSFLGGPHDYLIETGGVKVFPRIVPREQHRDFVREPVSCGIEGMDILLGGGLDRGTSNLLMGPSGTGKSSLAITYAHFAAARGERVALFTFDENLDLYLAKAIAFGIDLRPFIREGILRAQQVDPAELSPGQFAHLLLNFVERENVRMVIIDSLNGYSKAMQDGKILDLQLHEMLTYLGQLGVVTIMVLAQSGFLNEFRSPVDLTYLADTVIILRHFEARGAVRQAISVAKKRSGGHENTIREFKVECKRIVGWGTASSIPRRADRSAGSGIRARSAGETRNGRLRQLMRADTNDGSQIILILAPAGRDADVAVSVLRNAGVVSQPCQSVSELCQRLRAEGNSVGALVLTEESLASPSGILKPGGVDRKSGAMVGVADNFSNSSRPADESHRATRASSEPSRCGDGA